MSDETEGWVHCDACGEDWPADAFTASGSAYIHRRHVCDACFADLYPRRKVPCAVCGRVMGTRGYASEPTHRDCRRVAA